MNLPDMGECDGVGGQIICGLQYNIQFVNTMLLYHSYFYFTGSAGGLCINVSEKSTMVPSMEIVNWLVSILRKHRCVTQVNVMKNMANEPIAITLELFRVIFREMHWIKDARLYHGLGGLGFEHCKWSEMNTLFIGYLGTPVTGPVYDLISSVKYDLTLITNLQFRMPLNRIVAKNVSVKYRLNNSTLYDELYGNTSVEFLTVQVPWLTTDVSRFFDIHAFIASLKSLKRASWVFENPVDYVYLLPILDACKHLARVDVRVCEFSRSNCHYRRGKWGYSVHVFLTEALLRYRNAYFNIPLNDDDLMEAKLLRFRPRWPQYQHNSSSSRAVTTGRQEEEEEGTSTNASRGVGGLLAPPPKEGIAQLMSDHSAVVSLAFEAHSIGGTVHRYHDRVIVYRSTTSYNRTNAPPLEEELPRDFFFAVDRRHFLTLHLEECSSEYILKQAVKYVGSPECTLEYLTFNYLVTAQMMKALQSNRSVKVIGSCLNVRTEKDLQALINALKKNRTLQSIEMLIIGPSALSCPQEMFDELYGAIRESAVTAIGIDCVMREATKTHAAAILGSLIKPLSLSQIVVIPEAESCVPTYTTTKTTEEDATEDKEEKKEEVAEEKNISIEPAFSPASSSTSSSC